MPRTPALLFFAFGQVGITFSPRTRKFNDMKPYQLVMPAVLILFLLSSSAIAQSQDSRGFGKGRFLRRLRNDISKSVQQANKAKSAAKPTKADPRAKTPTLADRPGSSKKVPTPATRPSAAPTPAANPAAKFSARKNSEGFGMVVVAHGDNYVVARIDQRGNAYEAGIRQGDRILSTGGAELSSMEQYNDIADLLGNGDQLEFEIARRGEKKKVNVQFGEAPEEGEFVEENVSDQTPAKNNYSFVPQRDETPRTGTHSILNGSSARAATSVSSTNLRTRGQLTTADRTIRQQRQQIEHMQREIERLKAQAATRVAPSTVLDGPLLSGPGQ